jgi:hypothetical protein
MNHFNLATFSGGFSLYSDTLPELLSPAAKTAIEQ